MRKVKVISSTTPGYVEHNVDKWLQNHMDAEIVSVENNIRWENGATLTTIIYDIKTSEETLLP